MTAMNAPKWRRVTGADSFVEDLLTLTGQPLNTETVVLGAKTYTFQTTLTDVDGNVAIGADTATSIANLIAAITLGAGVGTLYATSMTAHANATAQAGAPGDTTMVARAKTAGVAGNSIATTETLTNGSWRSTKLGLVYVDLNMEGHDRDGLRLLLSCAAGTVTATLESAIRNVPDPANVPVADWDDTTNDTFGVASLIAAATAADDTWIDNLGILGLTRHSRIKIAVGTTATTVVWSVDHVRK